MMTVRYFRLLFLFIYTCTVPCSLSLARPHTSFPFLAPFRLHPFVDLLSTLWSTR
jgi:hypothetical protein